VKFLFALAVPFLIAMSFIAPAMAVEPDEILADPVMESRAREISQELRCVVCQNQVIDDSDAPLARDMRILVRERIVAGDTDEEVKAYLVDRYGNFVLMRPPLNNETILLWFGPLLALAAAFAGFAIYMRRAGASVAADPEKLSEDETERLKALTGKSDEA
jgi:cytochrome c-type biogenesis protein CcmH